MPPLFAHDPLDAVQRAAHPGWWLAPATALSVACEHWVLALLALATYAWLERDVASVLKTFLPLVVALGMGIGVVAACGGVGVLAGWGVRGVPSGHALWGAAFAVYTGRVYRSRWRAGSAGLTSGAMASRALRPGGASVPSWGWWPSRSPPASSLAAGRGSSVSVVRSRRSGGTSRLDSPAKVASRN